MFALHKSIFDILQNKNNINENLAECHNILLKHLQDGLEMEVISNYEEGKNFIQVKPLSLLHLRKMVSFTLAQCGNDYANIDEILNGNQIPFIKIAIEEFICSIHKNNASQLIYYNGEPMDINDVAKNIFSRSIIDKEILVESDFKNQDNIYASIIEYFCWSYCFFLHSRFTVTGLIRECNLILHQEIFRKQLNNEILQLTQKAEMLEQIQENMINKSNTNK